MISIPFFFSNFDYQLWFKKFTASDLKVDSKWFSIVVLLFGKAINRPESLNSSAWGTSFIHNTWNR